MQDVNGNKVISRVPITHAYSDGQKLSKGSAKEVGNDRVCEVWRNSFFGCYHSLPFFLGSLLLRQHCTSDASCCICLSLLLGIEKCIDSLASKPKGFFLSTSTFCSIFCKSSLFLWSSGNWGSGWDTMPGVPKGVQSYCGWDAGGNEGSFLLQWWLFPFLSSEAGILICLFLFGFFGLCQEQLENWFQNTCWWAHFCSWISIQFVTHSSSLSLPAPRTTMSHCLEVAQLSWTHFGTDASTLGLTCFSVRNSL